MVNEADDCLFKIGLCLIEYLARHDVVHQVMQIFLKISTASSKIGHRKLLKIWDQLAEEQSKDAPSTKFQLLNDILCFYLSQSFGQIVDLSCLLQAIVRYINSILGEITDIDFEYRIHLRNQLFLAGLRPSLRQVKQLAVPSLRPLITSFETLMRKDSELFKAKHASNIAHFTDVDKLSQHLVASVRDDDLAMPQLMEILLLLNLVRNEKDVKFKYFKLIKSFTELVVLQGKGIDPDFSSIYSCDLEGLLEVCEKSVVIERIITSTISIADEDKKEEIVAEKPKCHVVDKFQPNLAVEKESTTSVATAGASVVGLERKAVVVEPKSDAAVETYRSDTVVGDDRACIADNGVNVCSRKEPKIIEKSPEPILSLKTLDSVVERGPFIVYDRPTQPNESNHVSGNEVSKQLIGSQASSSLPPPPPPPPMLNKAMCPLPNTIARASIPSAPPPPPPPCFPKSFSIPNTATPCIPALPSAATQAPPPPPMLGQSRTPVVASHANRPKLKPMAWDKIPASSINNSIWEQISSSSSCNSCPASPNPQHSNALASPTIALQLDLLKEEFKVISTKKEPALSGSCNASRGTGTVGIAPRKVSFLTAEHSRKIGITLKRFKFTPNSLSELLLENPLDDGSLLTEESLEQLAKCFKIDDFTLGQITSCDITSLADEDLVLLKLSKVPRYSDLLDILYFMKVFHKSIFPLLEKLNQISTVLTLLTSSTALFRLFKFLLDFGNKLNAGTFRGESLGFKLSSLRQMLELRSNSNKTVLEYLVDFAANNNDIELLDLPKEFRLLKAVSECNFRPNLCFGYYCFSICS